MWSSINANDTNEELSNRKESIKKCDTANLIWRSKSYSHSSGSHNKCELTYFQ